jgi:hypothetical protein
MSEIWPSRYRPVLQDAVAGIEGSGIGTPVSYKGIPRF